MTIRVARYDHSQAQEWNALVARARNGLFLFDRRYMDYHSERFEDCSAVVHLDGRVAAVMPASIDRQSGLVSSHAGLTFGGLVIDRELRGTLALPILDEVLAALREWGGTTLEVRLLPSFMETYPSGEIGYGLWRRGFEVVRRDLSSVMPLTAPIAFNSSKKQALAKARKSGLIVSAGSPAAFHRLLEEVLEWRHGAVPVHSLVELDHLLSAFPDRMVVRSVELQGDTLAGALVYRHATAWHTQYLASSPDGRSNGALDLVIAAIIEEASAAGVDWLSFGTSTTDGGHTLNEGLLWQKESFGARSLTHDLLRGTL